MPPPPVPRKRKLNSGRASPSPEPESSASPSSHDADGEYRPGRAVGGAARPKRAIQSKQAASGASPPVPEQQPQPTKMGPNGRPMSREQLRKANHSLIERRRREKINYALAELRSMVPGLGDDGAKGGEFKLEVG